MSLTRAETTKTNSRQITDMDRKPLMSRVVMDVLVAQKSLEKANSVWKSLPFNGLREDILLQKLCESWFHYSLIDGAVVLDNLKAALEHLSSDVNRLIDTVQTTSVVFMRQAEGIKQLPGELILRICDHLGSPKDLIRFGGVCHSFRVITQMPSKGWATLHCGWPLKLNELCIARTKGQPLSVEINSFERDVVDPFLDLGITTSSRWSHLMVDLKSNISSYVAYTSEAYHNLLARLASLDLSKLRSLDLRQHSTTSPNAHGFDAHPFVQSLDIPSVRSLRLVNVLPRSIGTNSLMSLTVCWIPNRTNAFTLLRNMRPIANIISSTPTLKFFSFGMEGINGYMSAHDIDDLPPVCLPNIEAFTFDYFQHQTENTDLKLQLVYTVLRVFDMPNVVEVNLNLRVGKGFGIDMDSATHGQFLHALFPDPHSHRRLTVFKTRVEVLHIRLRHGRNTNLTYAWPLPIGFVSNTETYELSTTLNPEFSIDGPQLPSRLRRLVLSDCPRLNAPDFELLTTCLRRAGALETLEAIDIVDCPQLRKDESKIRRFVAQASMSDHDREIILGFSDGIH